MKLTKARLQQIIKEEIEASEVDEGVLDKIKGLFKKDGGGLPFFSIDQKSIMALINNDFPELKGNDPDAFKMQKMFNADPEGVQKKLALKYLNIITGMPTSNTSFDKAFAKYQKDTARRDGKTGVGKNLRDEIGRDRDKGELAKALYSIIYSAYGNSPAYKEFQKNTKRYHGYLAAKDAARADRVDADIAKAGAEFRKGQPSRPPGSRPIPRHRGNPFDLGEGQEMKITKEGNQMKLTKARLQQIIKEEIEGTQEQSHAFEIYSPGFYKNDPNTTIMYVENVPMSMIDTKEYVGLYTRSAPGNTGVPKPGEGYLEISKEGLQKLGFKSTSDVMSRRIDDVPERIEVTVPYNPRTGEFMLDNLRASQNPKVVDASGM